MYFQFSYFILIIFNFPQVLTNVTTIFSYFIIFVVYSIN